MGGCDLEGFWQVQGQGTGGKDRARQLESDTASRAGAPSVAPSVSPEGSISQFAARRVQALATLLKKVSLRIRVG